MPRFVPTGAAAAFLKRAGTVSGFTMLSRASGFVRDVVLAAILGAGPLADAFFIALRLPNHFRAIFAEGAFNSAFVPTYAGTLQREGVDHALTSAGRIAGALTAIMALLLVAAEIWTRPFLVLLTPDFGKDPVLGDLTVALTRITFPYLTCVTAVTVMGAVLNAHQRFAAAAAAPILFNMGVVVALAIVAAFGIATGEVPAYAAAIGVTAAGVAEIALLVAALRRAGLPLRLRRPSLDPAFRTFLRRLGPAVIGSGASQIAMFVDTIVAAALPVGAVSALYYADRLYQLPIGVIGVAIGTVLLPELSRRIAAGDEAGARRAQARAVVWSAVLTLPFVLAFLVLPEFLVALAFKRGAFHADAVIRAGITLQAYAVGLMAIVLLRSVVSGFHARGDTTTPMLVAFLAIGVNVALKLWLTRDYDVVGLAVATSVGAWVNLLTLMALELRRRRRADAI